MASRLIRILILAGLASSASAPSAAEEPECFDADVSAVIVRQVPTIMPRCADCIIFKWPWIVDLRVQHVHSGSVERGRLTVQTIQHTDYRSDLGKRRWWLRRNTLGGFNAELQSVEAKRQLCFASAKAVPPFTRPGPGRSLDDLRREGARHYGRDRAE